MAAALLGFAVVRPSVRAKLVSSLGGARSDEPSCGHGTDDEDNADEEDARLALRGGLRLGLRVARAGASAVGAWSQAAWCYRSERPRDSGRGSVIT